MSFPQIFLQGDAITRLVAVLLLAMSVASWVVIVWKGWLLRRTGRDLARATAAFWQAGSMEEARLKVGAFDREALLLPLIEATQVQSVGTLAAAGERSQQLTRVLRDALHGVLRRLQFGQVLLATVGSTAPFVGLLGTVWGIYHALTGMASAGQITIDRIAGPVGEALIMTAAGLAVAIPAVLAYNVLGRLIGQIEADLEGFALDLRELLLGQSQSPEATLSAAGPSQGTKAPSPSGAQGTPAPGGSAVHEVTSVGA
ncbi:MotA/TolQ/ExbB proton channel family protein [Curvibacter delicatus]|jgi:biopolymer transport protein ExbB|uniref:MotA/TolQ/ExbB proton channel family protein n=1 Tax=Curvibacter delicatus TaxID=80879 RepID=UPI0009FFBEE2|nr:MotA/TolQ/ExbB proton channel family protein [Curvibacter delicatus]